jgi:hypothetical protein
MTRTSSCGSPLFVVSKISPKRSQGKVLLLGAGRVKEFSEKVYGSEANSPDGGDDPIAGFGKD